MTLAQKALVYFSANPHEMLTTEDIKIKWGTANIEAVTAGLPHLVESGWLTKKTIYDRTSRNGRRAEYSAGPKILAELGIRR